MNYPPNSTHWNVGDIVIHDMDAKREEFLMKVIFTDRVQLWVTQYLSERWAKDYPQGLKNELRVLHDPQQFGLVNKE